MTAQHFPSASEGSDIRLDVSRGLVAGHSFLHKFGYNGDCDDGTEETVWDAGGTYTYISTATTVHVSSSATADDDGSTGATEIQIEGLDANYNELIETVTLDGRTQVETTGEFLRVHRAFVTAVGSGGTAAGDIYVATSGATNGVPTGTTYAKINQGSNQTLMSVYTVPAGKTLFIDDVQFTTAVDTGKSGVFRMMVRRTGQPFRDNLKCVVQNSTHVENYTVPLAIPEKSDIEIRVVMDTNDAEASATFQGCLIDNDFDI